MNAYRSLIRWIGDKPWFRWSARWVLPTVDRFLLRFGWRATPFPTLLLTTDGHKSGEPHHAPLYYLKDEGFVVIASNYGNHEPDWSRNLAITPTCTVKVGRATMATRAEPVAADQWHRYLDRFAEFYPSYRDYVARAGREIPMWRLVPQSAEA